MTGLYVVSNPTSLAATYGLNRSMGQLTDVLTRLSTGLKINSGKDDPAGLIASELMKSDMTATTAAIKNTQMANSMIAVADSALGQISALLNDIRGLVNEAANTGAMSDEQIEANQLQVDASLDSIDRIARTTNFQGKLILDGSLGFTTTGVSNKQLESLNIYQANFGTASEVDIKIEVTRTADTAKLYFNQSGISEAVVMEIGGNLGSYAFSFEAGADVVSMANRINSISDSTGVRAVVGRDATYGQLLATSAGENNDINFKSKIAGEDGGDYSIKYVAGNSTETTYTITPPMGDQSGVIEFQLKMEPWDSAKATGLDESYNGIHTTMLNVDAADSSNNIVIQGSNGKLVRTYSVVQTTDATTQPSVDFDATTGHLQILVNFDGTNITTTNQELADAIAAIDGLEIVQFGGAAGDAVNLVLTTAKTSTVDVRTNNGLDIVANTAGTKFDNTDVVYLQSGAGTGVSFHYSDTASKSATTITTALNPDAATADTQYMRLTAKTAGSQYNEVGVEFYNTGGALSVVYDEGSKVLRVYGGTGTASLGDLKGAIEANSPFVAEFYKADTATPSDPDFTQLADLSTKMAFGATSAAAYDATVAGTNPYDTDIKTGQISTDLGTDHQALIITVGADATAQDVINAFENDPLRNLFTITNSLDSNGTGKIFWNAAAGDGTGYTDPASFVYSAALKGGTAGYKTAVTAKELVDFVNNDAVLSQILEAQLALNTPTGTGLLTLFEEYTYFGDPNSGTGLQFLGPAGSKDIVFGCNPGEKNQELAVYFTPDTLGYASVALQGKNANSSVKITADRKGGDYDNMVVRYIRLGNDNPLDSSYVTYEEGPSNAMAYCSIDDRNTGSTDEVGKFIVYSNTKGDAHNNVAVVAKLDRNQSEAARAYFDAELNQLVVSVNSASVSLSDAVAAINNEGTFSADYDFSYNNNVDDTGPANSTFEHLLGGSVTSKEIGNTGVTGGYDGGVLTVYLAGDEDPADPTVTGGPLSAQSVVNLINNDPVTAGLFTAGNYGSSDGSGLISFRDDNLKTVTGGCGQTFTIPTATSSGGIAEEGVMVIQLATDKYGNFITTADELVAFFDTLTPEETGGVSVSVVRPVGVDNLNRTWTTDPCDNVIESQDCGDGNYGYGILKPNCYIDECENIIYETLHFTSYGSNIQDASSNGDIVAVQGWQAQFNISAINSGSEYDGVTLVYEKITDPIEEPQPSATWDEARKQIIVRIFDGVTTAAEVKAAIESSESTRDLFSVTLKRDGSSPVTISDDSLTTAHGTYEAGYRGGAHMLGAADEDPHKLTFEAMEEGSNQFVTVNISDGEMNIVDENGKLTNRAYGIDTEATLNGDKMTAKGRNLTLSTSMLQLDAKLGEDVQVGDIIEFKITGGGAIFQLGPDVVTSQQIRIGIPSISTASLGGASGKMYQLRTGGTAALDTDTKLADRIVQEAITAIASLRGRLGAIQRCTLDPNIAALQDNLEQLTSAQAEIESADFAVESANLARAQVLVQSGARVVGIANQLPQYAASLLG